MAKLSYMQERMLTALRRLPPGKSATAAELGAMTGQSSDGAAATLGSLVNRGLAERAYAEASGYRLTELDEASEDYCGCCGGLAAEPPKGEHDECCRDLHDA